MLRPDSPRACKVARNRLSVAGARVMSAASPAKPLSNSTSRRYAERVRAGRVARCLA
jgi:hypothetical protein